MFFLFFFFNDTATTEIYTLSLHDALPICNEHLTLTRPDVIRTIHAAYLEAGADIVSTNTFGCAPYVLRSEEHTSELQSQSNLVCRLLLEKKKKHTTTSAA